MRLSKGDEVKTITYYSKGKLGFGKVIRAVVSEDGSVKVFKRDLLKILNRSYPWVPYGSCDSASEFMKGIK